MLFECLFTHNYLVIDKLNEIWVMGFDKIQPLLIFNDNSIMIILTIQWLARCILLVRATFFFFY